MKPAQSKFDAEHRKDAASHVGNVTQSIDLDQNSTAAVDGKKWRGLLCVQLKATTNHVFSVVGPALLLRTLNKASYNSVDFYSELNDGVEVVAIGMQDCIKFAHLLWCAA
jgi:hypothetical protein